MTSEAPLRHEQRAPLRLSEWERGVAVSSADDPAAVMYLWFWEWNMFGAVSPGPHTHGTFENSVRVTKDGQSATISTEQGLSLSMSVGSFGVTMELEVTNSSGRDWDELAAIIPCFSPGPVDSRSELFRTNRTSFVGSNGFECLAAREIHFNARLRESVLGNRNSEGRFPWSDKWPISSSDAARGVLVRESSDSVWSTGIAWDRFLSAQGNNPWECMHLAVQVGPLAPAEKRNVRGNIYMMKGNTEDILEVHDKRD